MHAGTSGRGAAVVDSWGGGLGDAADGDLTGAALEGSSATVDVISEQSSGDGAD